MADPSLASNNPFRRKSTVPIASSTPSPSAASGLTLDTSSTGGPAHPSLAKSSTFPQSPSDAPFNTHGGAGAPGASGPTGSSGSADDTYAYGYEDQGALRGRPQVSSDAFREHLQALPKSTEAPPSTTFLKPKPVKKVRVQSPPPSSPSSVDSVDADFEARFPSSLAEAASRPTGAPAATSFSDYSARGGLLDDRPVRNYEDFESESDDSELDGDSAGRAGGSTGHTAPISSFSSIPHRAPQQPPANPFEKTLGDLEPGQTSTEEAQSDPAAAASAGKATLDVDAFSRLLLTGQGPAATPPPPPPARAEAHPPAQETRRTSHEISENDDDHSGLIHGGPSASEPTHRQTLRKKPPPPSSRHGKLIKGQPKEKKPAKESSSGGEDPSSSSSDVNKPLPPPPARRQANASEDEDTMDSIFDRETAGKLPEVNLDPEAPEEAVPSPRPPTPPNASHSTDFDPSHPVSDLGTEALVSSSAVAAPVVAAATTASSSRPKKPTPAPPPRRQAGHNRTESRSHPAGERPPLPAPPAHAAAYGDGNVSDQQRDRSPYASPRSSLDSTRTRSRSSSLIKPGANANPNHGVNAPAPPPPRRGNHAARPSTTSSAAPLHPPMSSPALSPSALSDHERTPGGGGLHPGVSTPTLVPQAGSTSGSGSSTPVPNRLLAKPPPPPVRNTSVRHKERPTALTSTDSGGSVGSGVGSGRPPSVASSDAVARRVGPHHQPPPPPPTRQRGSSRGSMEAPASHANATLLSAAPSILTAPRKVSSESVRRAAGSSGQQGLEAAQEGDEDQANNAAGVDESGVANDILADLDALQREVDALRGQFKAG